MDNNINKLPAHVGIIMDGNRRWAKKRMLPAVGGHKKGAEIFRARVKDLSEVGIANATFYTLSTENLDRDKEEVDNLIRLFESQLYSLEKITDDNNIRLLFIGDLSVFPDGLREKMKKAERGSVDNNGMVCRLAVNYGAKAEIVRAVRQIAETAAVGGGTDFSGGNGLSGKSAEEAFAAHLYTKGAPDVDLIIRTGGEKRLSNFLLWQSAYAELYFSDTLWCDFSKAELVKALEDYAARSRRHGK